MIDEIWTMRDGTKIAVSDMEESHVRNALRMVIRKTRRRLARKFENYEMTVGEAQDKLSNLAWNDLSNPNAYFPLLEGGRYGSPDLAARHDPRRR